MVNKENFRKSVLLSILTASAYTLGNAIYYMNTGSIKFGENITSVILWEDLLFSALGVTYYIFLEFKGKKEGECWLHSLLML